MKEGVSYQNVHMAISTSRSRIIYALLLTIIMTWPYGGGAEGLTLVARSVFDEVQHLPKFMDQVLQIESEVCGSSSGSICQMCYRDKLCRIYHDCCPRYVIDEAVTYTDHAVECLPTTPFPVDGMRLMDTDHNQMMISHCPRAVNTTNHSGSLESKPISNNVDDDVTKCHEHDVTNFDQSAPVTSRTSHLLYKNKYCAACHGDGTDLIEWGTSVSCKGSPSKLISAARSKSELFQILMSSSGVQSVRCELEFVQPEHDRTFGRPCTYVAPNVINSCNVTGDWEIYDQRLEKACGVYTSVFKSQYKNMFCYLCNIKYTMTLTDMRERTIGTDANVIGRVSYSALLDFRDTHAAPVQDPEATKCPSNQFYDTAQCACRSPSCSEGKFLSDNGTCQGILNSNFLGYRVCGNLELETETPVTEMNMDPIWLTFTKSPIVREGGVSLMHWCPDETKISFYISLKALKDPHSLNDGFSTLEELESEIDILFANNSDLESVWKTQVLNKQFTSVYPCLRMSVESFPCPQNKSLRFYSNMMIGRREPLGEGNTHFIDYHKTTTCPFVETPLVNFTSDPGNQRYLYADTNNSIAMSEVTTINQSTVWICVSDYTLLTGTDFQKCVPAIDPADSWTVVGLISVICTCISLLCLLLTFITFIILPPLRTGAGMNVITLIVTLFAAQAFHEFALEQYENADACIMFGIIIHYTWLAATFSMNACTFERFLKLCFPLRTRVFFMSKKPFILATTYTFVGPLIIVTINIVANVLTRDNIGYGNARLCFINTLVSRIVAFALPIAIIVLANLCQLVVTIYKLKSNTQKKSAFHVKLGLVACVRLSSVAGLTWFLAFLYEAIPSQAMDYIISALIALQGVLFFFSIVLNKRILDLLSTTCASCRYCISICNCQKPPSPTSGTASTSLTGSHSHSASEKTAGARTSLVNNTKLSDQTEV